MKKLLSSVAIHKSAKKSLPKNFLNTQKKFYAKDASNTVGEESVLQPSYKFPEFLTRAPPTQVTTLKNGFKVITEKRLGETASVGVFIGTGSRHENITNNGVAHFMEHMNFKGTEKRTSRDIEVEFENMGASLNAHTAREYTAFTAHSLKQNVPNTVDVLADVLLNSKLKPEHVEAERSVILREMEEVNTNMEEVLLDQLHLSAFQGSSLGFTILGPKENINTINRQQMVSYRNANYTANRMVLVGVGNVEHEKLVELGEKYFSEVPAGKESSVPEARYIGSEVRVQNPEIPLLHFAVAFQGPGLASKDILAVSLIQLMIGSFDKAMGASKYVSTPYCQRIAELELARSAQTFNHAYSDRGLFGIYVVSDGGENTDALMCDTVSHMTRFCYKVGEQELERAKNMFKTQILSLYEGNLNGVLDEIGKQMLYYGRRASVAEMFARIDAISTEDIKRVATKYIYDKDPVAVSIGHVDEVVDWSWLRIHTYSYKK